MDVIGHDHVPAYVPADELLTVPRDLDGNRMEAAVRQAPGAASGADSEEIGWARDPNLTQSPEVLASHTHLGLPLDLGRHTRWVAVAGLCEAGPGSRTPATEAFDAGRRVRGASPWVCCSRPLRG